VNQNAKVDFFKYSAEERKVPSVLARPHYALHALSAEAFGRARISHFPAAQAIADEFDKGSTHVFDTIFNSQAQPPSPVPSRAALAEPP
jgi:hypothetical protein